MARPETAAVRALTAERLSPAQAAERATARGRRCTRWTIKRAIEANEIEAYRNNRGHWLVDVEALDRWAGAAVRAAPPLGPDAAEAEGLRAELARLVAEAEGLRERLAVAEADRDRWHAQAEALARRPRLPWPFG